MKRFTLEERLLLEKLLQDHQNNYTIAKILNRTTHSIKGELRRNGKGDRYNYSAEEADKNSRSFVLRKVKNYTYEEMKMIEKLIKENKTNQEISEQVGRTKRAIDEHISNYSFGKRYEYNALQSYERLQNNLKNRDENRNKMKCSENKRSVLFRIENIEMQIDIIINKLTKLERDINGNT